MSSEPLNFEPVVVRERRLICSSAELDILALLGTAMSSSTYPDIDGKANHFVTGLVAFISNADSGLDSKDVADATWQALIIGASCVRPPHEGQDVLVRIVSLLGDAGDAWKGYPGWGIAMRENWNRSPVYEPAPSPKGEDFTLDEWLNVNSFAARMGDKFISFGLWELRCGLEGDFSEGERAEKGPEALVNTRTLVATEWMVQGGRELLRRSLLNSLSGEVEGGGNPWAAGPLFPGSRGFNLERRGFWKRRLEELRETAVERTQIRIDEAVERMTALEVEAAKALDLN